MSHYDVIIIGSGLGGLTCGYILSRKGFRVCLLEKNEHIGGCLQTFKRGAATFDTGFHYVGGLEPGQSLYPLFRYFNLLDLPWQKLDETGYAEVRLNDRSYLIPSGHERFADTMSARFPHQKRQIAEYTTFLKNVGSNILNSFMPDSNNPFSAMNLINQSAYQFLNNMIDDPELRNVLSGASLTMELCPEQLPLYVFAQINNSFIQSAWRLRGGGSLIAERLAEDIRSMGGEVLTNAEVIRINERDGLVSDVVCKNGEQLTAKFFISSIHPNTTFALIPESPSIRKVFRRRMAELTNTHGMFTAHLQLKRDTMPYLNRNIFVFDNHSPWDYADYRPNSGTTAALISFQAPSDGSAFTQNIDILTPMHWQEVERWDGKRETTYREFKIRKAKECIELASKHLPNLPDAIERTYTSTPLTYRDYTGTWQGSAYGIRKDYNRPLYTMLAPQTQLHNLFMTGQNLNLHGVLGVSMTSFFTCAQLTPMNELVEDLIEFRV